MSKEVEFSARPRLIKDPLPNANEWVRKGGEGADATSKLTLRMPSELHTQFKLRCVREGLSLQEKIHAMILAELAADRQIGSDS